MQRCSAGLAIGESGREPLVTLRQPKGWRLAPFLSPIALFSLLISIALLAGGSITLEFGLFMRRPNQPTNIYARP
jgi:hypothetical protein